MNILIIAILILNVILLPLAAYIVVGTLSRKLDTNARWHRQVLAKEVEALLVDHENRFAGRLSHSLQR